MFLRIISIIPQSYNIGIYIGSQVVELHRLFSTFNPIYTSQQYLILLKAHLRHIFRIAGCLKQDKSSKFCLGKPPDSASILILIIDTY